MELFVTDSAIFVGFSNYLYGALHILYFNKQKNQYSGTSILISPIKWLK